MKVIYEAKDGTQFDTEEACKEYEARYCALLTRYNFIAMDKNVNRVLPGDSDGYGYRPEDFDYFACFTEEGLEGCKELFRENGIRFDFPLELNKVYHYNYEREEWRPLSDRIIQLQRELNRLSNIEKEVLSAKQS